MVLTRRAAKAESDAATTSTLETNSNNFTQSTNEQQQQPLSHTQNITPHSNHAYNEDDNDLPKDNDSDASSQKETNVKLIKSDAQRRESKFRAAISWRLGFGHLFALVAVITVAHAAKHDFSSGTVFLPVHALILFLCTTTLRTILAFSSHSVRRPIQQSGMVLALSAAVQFSSNSLHLLAAVMFPTRLSSLVGYAVVDVSANWLQMTVHASTPREHPFAIFSSLLYTAADIFLAALIAGKQSFIDVFYPFLPLRFLANLRLLVVCSTAIVNLDNQDNAQRATASAPR